MLLEPDLSTLALKQVEMSHLATFKLLLKLFKYARVDLCLCWDIP